MKNFSKYFLLFALCLLPFIGAAQDIDSLKLALKNARSDKDKVSILIKLTELESGKEILKYAQPALQLSEKLLADKATKESDRPYFLKIKAAALGNMAYALQNDGDIFATIDLYQRSLKILTGIGDTLEMASVLSNLGIFYYQKGNVSLALQNLDQSLKLQEAIGDTDGIADSYNNIANVYTGQKDHKKALEYCKLALAMQMRLGNEHEIARSHNNVGAIYSRQQNYAAALDHYNQGLKILEKINYTEGIAYMLSNIGSIYHHKDDFENALLYYYKSLQLQKEVENQNAIASSQFNLGSVYYHLAKAEKAAAIKKNKLALSRSYLDSSLILSKYLGYSENIRNAEEKISKVDSMNGNYKGAFEHYKQYIIYRDSISNEGTRKASLKSQLSYEFTKKEAVIKEQQEKERVVAEEKNRFQKIVIASVLIGLLLVIVFAVFIFRSLKVTKHQKHIIEEKQKEILDSIRYAKRIQTSLLPTEKYISKQLTNTNR